MREIIFVNDMNRIAESQWFKEVDEYEEDDALKLAIMEASANSEPI